METSEDLVALLCGKDNTAAYGALQELLRRSAQGSGVYAYMDRFIELMDSPNSLARTRGLLLIAANAPWDTEYKVDAVIGQYLRHVIDPKPITARQCIGALPGLAAAKPDLREEILRALHGADPGRYAPSMGPLVYRDIRAALDAIERLPIPDHGPAKEELQ